MLSEELLEPQVQIYSSASLHIRGSHPLISLMRNPKSLCVVLCQYSNPHLTAPRYAPASSYRFQMLQEKGHANLSFGHREKAAVEEFNK